MCEVSVSPLVEAADDTTEDEIGLGCPRYQKRSGGGGGGGGDGGGGGVKVCALSSGVCHVFL